MNFKKTFLMLLLVALAVVPLAGVSAQDDEPAYTGFASALAATAMDGAPEGQDEEAWLEAAAIAWFDMGSEGTDTVSVLAVNLVPEGLYTMWWVNDMMDPAAMSLGPVGGTPNNEFTADEDGSALVSIEVASDNDYQAFVIAYHADGTTYGEMPGEMGVVTFSHLMGAFPGPANIETLGVATVLGGTDMDGAPEGQDAETWVEAAGIAYAGPTEDENVHQVVVITAGLVSEGLYTLWWVNDMMDAAAMSLGPVGGTPANEFTANESGSAVINLEVPADNDYQTLVIAFHADGTTYGEMPGEMGVVTFSHLMGAFPSEAGLMTLSAEAM